MTDSVKFYTKSFADLSDLEKSRLKKVGKINGAFLEILQSLKNNAIKNPDNIFLCVGYDVSNNQSPSVAPIVGWAMLDNAKEYNEKSENSTLMIFIRRKYRNKGISLLLIENLKEKMNNKICAYVTEGHRERKFFEKISKKTGIEILVENPLCYFAKYREEFT